MHHEGAGKMETSRIITDEAVPDKTRVGYVRVSSADQNEARQLEALVGLGLYKIYVEKISAKDTARPMLISMLEYVRGGDSIYIKDFSRLARSTKDLLAIAESLDARGVKLISLKEQLDTSTPTGKLMLTMIGAINTFERECLLERQREGIAIARREGKYKGRKAVPRPANWDEVYSLYRTRQITGTEAMRRLNLKRNTFYKMIRDKTPQGLSSRVKREI